jgi:hypothetical protein
MAHEDNSYWAKGKCKKYPYYSFALPGSTIRTHILEEKFIDLLGKYAFDTTHLKVLKDNLEKHFSKHSAHNAVANTAIVRISKHLVRL